jgi:glycogen synthase
MRILLISPEYPPFNIGGGGVVFKNLSKELKNKGHSVNVVAGNHTNKSVDGKVSAVLDDNVPVSFVPLFPFFNLKSANLKTYTPPTTRGFFFIIKQLIQNRTAVIHLHGFCHPLIDLTAFTCLAMGKKYVLTCHGIPKFPSNTNKFTNSAFQLYLNLIERTVVQKASALTTVSSNLKNECVKKRLINKKTFVIPNGGNLSLKAADPIVLQAIEEKYSLKDKVVVFAIGRLSENKGFQYLIEAMQTVVSSVPNSVAIIAGSGSYKQQLEELIISKGLRDKVKLIGSISEEEKSALYVRSDLVVFPSTNEPFGMVLLEASMMHKPIIGFDIESTREVLPKDSCVLVSAGDSLKLGQAIIDVITDSTLKCTLEANSKKVKAHSWEKITNQYINVYNTVS